jgi:thioesterase domain-containing protein/acyl carrier protein
MNDLDEESVLQRSELYLSTDYQKPEGEVAETIAGTWQRVLNVDLVGVNDDFFEIGGDSLAATVLASELEKHFLCKFSPSSMIEASTVATQTAYIEQQKPARPVPDNFIMCNAEGKRAPLFIVHGAIGYTVYDRCFLEGFDKDQPIVFIEAPGLNGKESPLECIEKFAERYLRAIRQVAPEGNWLLAANCAGGLIALEICKQAERAGERISRLMLIDPMPRLFRTPRQIFWLQWKKRWRAPMPARFRSGWKRLRLSLQNYLSRDDESELAYEVSLDARKQRQSLLEARIRMRVGEQKSSLIPSEIAYNAEAMRQVSHSFSKAIHDYASPRWEGEAFVFRGSESSRNLDVFNTYIPNAKIRISSYPHRNLFTDGILDVQKFLNDVIAADSRGTFTS